MFGDHAGHIIYDDATGEFLVGASTWGDFTYQGVQINYTRTSEDILHDVHVLEVQKLELPETPNITYINRGNWDPHFVRIGGEWYVAFVDSPSQGNPWKHYPALAKGPDLENLTLVGAESHLNETEGVVIQRFGGNWYLLCTSGDNERGGLEEGDLEAGAGTFRIYLLERDEEGHGLKFFGTLNADHPTNIPHPMVTPLPRDGNTKWVMFTFEGTMYYEDILGYGTHGNFIVMNGRPKQKGYEFLPREP